MKIILAALLLLSGTIVFAQDKSKSETKEMDTAVFQNAEIEASVDANQWIDHLRNNLQHPIEKAAKKGMKAGTYAVQVKFLVEKDGSINDVQALNDPGYGLA